MAKLLIVHHSPTQKVKSITDAVIKGTAFEGLESVEVVVKEALTATSADVLEADCYLLGTTANFGYISGALKHFFDQTFNATHETTKNRPFSYWIHGGYDTTGAEKAMQSITTGYGFKLAAKPLVFTGEVTDEHLLLATQLGANVAASVI